MNQPAADASCWVVIGCPRNLNEDVRSANAASVARRPGGRSRAMVLSLRLRWPGGRFPIAQGCNQSESKGTR